MRADAGAPDPALLVRFTVAMGAWRWRWDVRALCVVRAGPQARWCDAELLGRRSVERSGHEARSFAGWTMTVAVEEGSQPDSARLGAGRDSDEEGAEGWRDGRQREREGSAVDSPLLGLKRCLKHSPQGASGGGAGGRTLEPAQVCEAPCCSGGAAQAS